MHRYISQISCLLILVLLSIPASTESAIIERTAKDTITPLELDIGDKLHFTLHNGETRALELVDSGAEVLLTNIAPDEFKQERPDHGVMYRIWIDVTIDGQSLRLSRYLCSQFSFCEPYYVNGMRIWFEYNRAPMAFMTGNRGGVPRKEARIVVNDMTHRIAPDRFVAWYRVSDSVDAKEFANERIDARDNYKGDDMHMGGYFGATPHNGLDIDMPRGTEMIAPIDFDDHFVFSDSHRWRGIRKWDNGSEWWLQSHHLFRMVAPEYQPMEQGTQYALGAGSATGEAAHSHFVFRVMENEESYTVDAWLIFWQTFRDRQDARGDIRASMAPLSPVRTGERVTFSSAGSRTGSGKALEYSWSFGDGGTAVAKNPRHVYAKPGIYAVRLTVDDGQRLAHFVQHITVSGDPVSGPLLVLSAPDEIEFQSWPSGANLLNALDPGFMTHTLRFTARSTRPNPDVKRISLINTGNGELMPAHVQVSTAKGGNWCHVMSTGSGNSQSVDVSVDARGLEPGLYSAVVDVQAADANNGRQAFRVQLTVEADPPASGELVMLNSDPGFYATPWFWSPHSFNVNDGADISINVGRWDRPMQEPALLAKDGRNRMGLSDRYLSNGYRKDAGEFFRFSPDLAEGSYIVSTPEATPWDRNSEVDVRVRHADGETFVRYRPGVDPVIGTFRFKEGRDGFVEFYAENSVGQVTADALVFRNVDYDPPSSPDMDLESGLVAYWSFEKDQDHTHSDPCLDSVSGLSIGLTNASSDGSSWIAGRVGERALRFDGLDDYAVAGSLGLEPMQPRTIAAWVRLNSVDQAAGTILFGFDGAQNHRALMLTIPMFGNRITADIRDFAWTVQASRDTDWHHLALVWDGSTLYGYLDGRETIRAGNRYGKLTEDLFRVGSEGPFFKGDIDDIRVYGRALSREEISSLHAIGLSTD